MSSPQKEDTCYSADIENEFMRYRPQVQILNLETEEERVCLYF